MLDSNLEDYLFYKMLESDSTLNYVVHCSYVHYVQILDLNVSLDGNSVYSVSVRATPNYRFHY